MITKEKDIYVAESAIERIYGKIPKRPVHLSRKSESIDPSFAAGKATFSEDKLIIDLGEKEVFLPFISVIPKSTSPLPAIIYLDYENTIPNKFLPAEEIIDRGYAVFSACIKDIADNSPNFKSGISRQVGGSRRRRLSPGKIALWAWVAIRLAEYISDLDCIDKEKIIVAGHGILARAAMLAGGSCEEIKYIIANCITENPMPFSRKCDKSGTTVRDFSYLYSPHFAEEPLEDELESLLSFAKSKTLLLGFAQDSDCILPVKGQKDILTAPCCIWEDDFSYHIRSGTEYFSREDWNIYLDFIDKKA